MTLITPDERMRNVSGHIEILQELLGRKAPEGATQRIYRTRGIIEDNYIVLTLVQYLPGYQSPGGTPDVRIRLYVSRSYTYSSFGAQPTVQTALVGQYAVDEIVAFLALDLIPPDSIRWTDETKYSNLLVAGSIVQALHG